MAAPILLIDTYSAFFRAFHALPPMYTRAGLPTSALYGFAALLLKLLREHPGAPLGFALDGPEPTFRHLAFDGYKEGRPPLPQALHTQLRRLPALLEAFAVPLTRSPGFEADDVLATLARRAREEHREALVVSGDRDLLQVARGCVRVHFIGRRGKDALTYDEAAVMQRFGVPPTRLPAYMALVGDAADNIPSVPGIGPSTARRLLQGGAIDSQQLLGQLEGVTPPRIRSILEQHRLQILQSEALARLRDDVPLAADLPGWRIPDGESMNALAHQFEQLEFQSLVGRLRKLRDATEERG